jgi:hypothetical protein
MEHESLSSDQLDRMIAAWRIIDPVVAAAYEARRDALASIIKGYDPETMYYDDDDL